MNVSQAVMGFSQSEKIKTGLIWISQCLQVLGQVPDSERSGAVRMIKLLLNQVRQEIHLARNVAGGESWEGLDALMEQASVMIDSGVGEEGVYHLTKALSAVTDVGRRSMSSLKDQGLL